MFFIAYAFKGQVHVFAGQVKIVSPSSCRTSAILKYFCPLEMSNFWCEPSSTLIHYMSLNATKPVFGVSDKARLKPACSATENSYKLEISPVASLDMILFKKRIIKALISLRKCAARLVCDFVVCKPRRQVFSQRGQYICELRKL